MHTRVRNISFFGTSVYILNEWSLWQITIQSLQQKPWLEVAFEPDLLKRCS